MQPMICRVLLTFLIFLTLSGWSRAQQLPESAGRWQAGNWKLYVTFEVREAAGIARQQEPVEAQVRLPTEQVRVVRWGREPEEIVSQVLEARPDGAAYRLRLVFPATVAARDRVLYRVYYGHPSPPPSAYSSGLKVSGETRVGWMVENEHYRADATRRTVGDRGEDSGQIRALTLKFAEVTLLRSTGPRMHWAPNFQRTGEKSYRSIANWEPVQSVERVKGPVVCETRRAGSHQDYPEIALQATYRFFCFLPYFVFRSEMRMTRPIELFLLRNDEMTMDGFFTHVAWPAKDGTERAATFEEREKFLEKEPIAADAPWVCFFHDGKGYGYGSIRLKFDTGNAAGGPSPLYHPYTKISDGAGGGKYWNRRLVDERDTQVPAGSRYFEENAYVIFRLRAGTLPEKLGEFLEWERKLRKPLLVQLQTTPKPGKPRRK